MPKKKAVWKFPLGLHLLEEAETLALKTLVYAVCAHIFSMTMLCCLCRQFGEGVKTKLPKNTELISHHLLR